MDLFLYKNVEVDGLVADSRTGGVRCWVLASSGDLQSPLYMTQSWCMSKDPLADSVVHVFTEEDVLA